MSHVTGEGSTCEPNLTPLLDLILQILMFFIVCVKFVSAQVNPDIILPDAQSARPMDKNEQEVLFLNVDKEGRMLVLGKEEPLNLLQAKYYLQTQFDDAKRLADGATPNTIVVIRADKDADYAQVYRMLQTCRQTGYRRLELRVNIPGQPRS